MGSTRIPNWPDVDSIKIPKISQLCKINDLISIKLEIISNIKNVYKLIKNQELIEIAHFNISLSNETVLD